MVTEFEATYAMQCLELRENEKPAKTACMHTRRINCRILSAFVDVGKEAFFEQVAQYHIISQISDSFHV